MLAGVAAGVADYFDVDPVAVRVALVAAVLAGGFGVALWAAGWLMVPAAVADMSIADDLVRSERMS